MRYDYMSYEILYNSLHALTCACVRLGAVIRIVLPQICGLDRTCESQSSQCFSVMWILRPYLVLLTLIVNNPAEVSPLTRLYLSPVRPPHTTRNWGFLLSECRGGGSHSCSCWLPMWKHFFLFVFIIRIKCLQHKTALCFCHIYHTFSDSLHIVKSTPTHFQFACQHLCETPTPENHLSVCYLTAVSLLCPVYRYPGKGACQTASNTFQLNHFLEIKGINSK